MRRNLLFQSVQILKRHQHQSVRTVLPGSTLCSQFKQRKWLCLCWQLPRNVGFNDDSNLLNLLPLSLFRRLDLKLMCSKLHPQILIHAQPHLPLNMRLTLLRQPFDIYLRFALPLILLRRKLNQNVHLKMPQLIICRPIHPHLRCRLPKPSFSLCRRSFKSVLGRMSSSPLRRRHHSKLCRQLHKCNSW